MSYERALDPETLRQLLSDVFTDLTSVEDAPKLNDLSFNESEEQEKFYKSIDIRGNIYLIRNPALLELQQSRFVTHVRRTKPKKILSYSDAKKGEHKFYHRHFSNSENTGGRVSI